MSAETDIVGLPLEEAREILSKTEEIRFLPIGSIVTADYRPSRIRVWYDPETKIVVSLTKG